MNDNMRREPTLVLGGTGKTGRRVVERLTARGVPVRIGSRSGEPRFDWEDRSTWQHALAGARAVYLTYYPDLAVPGAVEATRAFAELAVHSGVRRAGAAVGPREPEAERGEQAVRDTGADLTVLRSTWFMQNFSEDYWIEHVLSGRSGSRPEACRPRSSTSTTSPDVAVAALTDDRHVRRLYELTGPRSLTFVEAAAKISAAVGREVRYTSISLNEPAAEAAEHGVPPAVITLLTYLFSEVLDGRNTGTTDGVRCALGREARDFTDYARVTAASGVWQRPLPGAGELVPPTSAA
jgi:uncharacterized protein YbjT (DUF2867 family)